MSSSIGDAMQETPVKQWPRILAICAALAAVTLVVYWPTTQHEFINFDDSDYVQHNVNVQKGFTGETVHWAFTTMRSSNWHPVTWLSHMLDCHLFGLDAGAHHGVTMMFHTLNAILVLLLFWRLTGAVWKSALVAGVFALHPMHVESVAWISERKDVLSGFFGLLTLLCYVSFARRRNWLTYGAALVLFAAGLMCKPMLITLPVILLLLDFWPLDRFKPGAVKLLIIEKIPFFALAIGASALGFMAQLKGGNVLTLEQWTPMMRLANTLVGYCTYVAKAIWPTRLAFLYPYHHIAPGVAIVAGIAIVVATAISLRLVRSRPYLAVGWLWFVIMLLPVIGLVKAGSQPISDRYTYLPYLGLSVAVIWGLEEFAARSQPRTVAVITGALAALAMLAIGTRQQLSYWQNSFTIFSRSIDMDPKNGIAHCYLGLALNDVGHWAEAEGHFRAALEYAPDLGQAHFGLGVVLLKKRQLDDAIVEFEKATGSHQNQPEFENNLGTALCMKGRSDEGIAHIRRAIELRPDYEVAYYNLGQALLKKGQIELAADAFEQAVAIKPDYLDAHVGLAGLRFSQGRRAEAITHYERAVTLQCNNPFVLNDFAWIRAADPHPEFRNGTQAVMLAERACKLTEYKMPLMIGTLAVAQAEAGRFDEAVASAEKARNLAMELGRPVLVKKNDELIRLFTDHQPYRQTESPKPSQAVTDKDASPQ